MNSWELDQVSLGISALWIVITRTITVGVALKRDSAYTRDCLNPVVNG